MTSLETDAITISTVLNRLENLETDTYIIAFGPKDKQFIATPNGYAAYVFLCMYIYNATNSAAALTYPQRSSLISLELVSKESSGLL
jgi:hypothetical protein